MRTGSDRLAVLVLVVVIVVVTLAIAGGVVSWQRYRAEVATEEVRASSNAAGSALAIDQFLAGRLALLVALADLPSVRSGQWEQMGPELGAMSAAGLGFDGTIGWIDSDGQLRSAGDDGTDTAPIDVSDRPYVAEVLESGEPLISDGLVGRRSGDPVVVLAAPASDGTDASGMLIATVRLADLDDVVFGLRMAGEVRVLDAAGHVVHQDGEAGSLDPADGDTASLVDRAGETPAVATDESIEAAALAPRSGWAVVYAPDTPTVSLTPVLVEWALLGALAILVILVAALAVSSNRRWKARTRRRAADLLAIDHLAEALARAEDTRSIARAAANEIRSAFDAALVLISVADEEAGGLVSIGASGMRNRDTDVEPLLPFDTPTLMTDAYRTDASIVVDRDAYVVRYPHMANAIPDTRIRMAVGHRFLGSKAGGAISMSFAHDREFGPDDDALLERLASMLPDAFARARASDRERASSLTLQESLLPTDRLTGFDTWQRATRYQPASDEARIGGDWFDIFEVGPHRIAVALGDIVGQGIQAAAVMGQMRSALRALARVSDGPVHALAELDRFSREVEGAFASTVTLAVIDTERRLIEVATAGHPPPILTTADGVVVADGARGAPVGVSTASPRTAGQVRLDEEQTILFYTDGLIERRGESIDHGLARLVRVVDEHRDEPLQRLVDLAIDGSADPLRRDDIAVVALRPVGARPRTFSASILSNPMSIRSARHDLGQWFDTMGLSEPRAADLLLAASEAMTNAMDHAYQGAGDGEILITGRARDGRIEVTVRDFGRWAPTVQSPVRGRGLAIIAAVTDESLIDPTPEGMEVRLVAILDDPAVTPRP